MQQRRYLAARVPTLGGHGIQARCCARNHSPVRFGSGLDRAGQARQAARLRLLLGTQEHADEVVRRARQCGHARRGLLEEVRALGVCHARLDDYLSGFTCAGVGDASAAARARSARQGRHARTYANKLED